MHSTTSFTSKRPRAIRFLGAALGLVLGIAPAVTFAASAEAAVSCPAVSFIGVRGSFEAAGTGTSASGASYTSGGFGGQIPALISTIRAAHSDLPMNTYGIKYPATVFPGQAADYIASKEAGAKALIKEMNYQASVCPATNIWLAGHSQGADVIGQVLSTPTSNQLSARAQQVLNGVVLLGDASYRNGERINWTKNTGTRSGVSSAGRAANSMNGWTGSSAGAGPIPLVRSYCYSNDLVCQAGSTASTGPHNSYNKDNALLANASSFLWNFIVDPQRLANKKELAQN